ncbi:MAG: SMC-Scp complex subunit ScpB [Solobacterium sp.]|nr:SMC-Scp complex subunit ScpB [Solobacterium sp.]
MSDTERDEGFIHMASIAEGLLFLTGDEGLTLDQLVDALGTTKPYAEKLMEYLMEYYANEDRGIEVARYGSVYRFLSKEFVNETAKKLFQVTKESRLSSAAMETLAVIAYKQPVTRVEIEEIRGVSSDMMIRKLQARGLIREAGRSEAPGRPFLYEVTEDFMDAFELVSLEELPRLPEFDAEEKNEELF